MSVAGDTITVTYGEQVFSPVSFNSFRTGPFTMQTLVREGESYEQAFNRCYTFLEAQARITYKAARLDFDKRLHPTGEDER